MMSATLPLSLRCPASARVCSAGGQSFNKLRIFNMTSFSKILFLDADILALRNMDHIMENDMFTGAVTFACCNHK